MNCADTSVIVAATLSWHPWHTLCRSRLESCRHAPGHAVAESYSVLTRLPAPNRIPPRLAADAIRDLVQHVLVLADDEVLSLPSRLAEAGVHGGATYDGMIALTAQHYGATLLTLDATASRTYQSLGADFDVLAAEPT